MKIKIIAAVLLVLCLCGCACNPGGAVTSGTDLSGSDINSEDVTERWEVSENDADYLAAMKERVAWALEALTELEERQEEFSEYGRAERLERSREFGEMKNELQGWCDAALAYPQDKVSSDLARNVYAKTAAFAGLLSDYLDIYPQIAVGEISGDEEKNALVDSAIELYMLLWG